MFRITTQRRGLVTAVALDGRLEDAELEEVRQVLAACAGRVELNLSGLETCTEAAAQELRRCLEAGGRIGCATPFLKMLLTLPPDRCASSDQAKRKP